MPNKIKVLFVIDLLKAGGAQRVMSYIAPNIDKSQFETTLAVTGHSKDDAFDLGGIEVVYFNKHQIRYAAMPLAKLIAKNNYDIVVSTLGHLNSMMAVFSLFFKSPVFIGRETSVIGKRHRKRRKTLLGAFLRYLQKSKLDIMICQSNDMFNDLHKTFGFAKEKLVIINNPVTDKFELKELSQKNDIPIFITVGRLSKVKGHKRIISALHKLDIDFKYFIIGAGSQQDKIFSQIKELGMEDKIQHVPFTKNVSKYLSQSDLYLQGSYVEGFPNALLESCAVGTPAIVFNAPGGINEIIEHDVNGYIVESEDEFILSIKSALQKNWNPEEIRYSVMKKYSADKIVKDYEQLFLEVLNR